MYTFPVSITLYLHTVVHGVVLIFLLGELDWTVESGRRWQRGRVFTVEKDIEGESPQENPWGDGITGKRETQYSPL